MKTLLFAAVLVLFASISQAQTNPTKVEFAASTDHNTTNITTKEPMVISYEFAAVGMAGAGALAITRSLGKPTPDAAGLISVLVPELATLTAGLQYTATVTAIGPTGRGVSVPSDPFVRLGPPVPPAPPGKPIVR